MDAQSLLESHGRMIFAVTSVILVFLLLLNTHRKMRENPSSFKNPERLATLLGIIWGLLIRLCFAAPVLNSILLTMSVGFLFVTPFVLGYLAIVAIPEVTPLSKKKIVFLPWIPTMSSMFIAGILGFEGAICLIMAAPLWLLIASLGGITGAIVRKSRFPNLQAITALLLLAPFGTSTLEEFIPSPLHIYRTTNEIRIHASPKDVWNNIREVPPIREPELPPSLVHWMGFPDPIEAKLCGSGVGAVRNATFAGGVEFTETITEWEEMRNLGFRIRANTEHIPKTTLDEHVTIGGESFDMLSGRYEIVPISESEVLLRLSSEHRLSTKFNLYASLWSKAIMSSIQTTILQVIKRRSEKANEQ